MKRQILFIALALGATALPLRAADPNDANYKLVWQENFNGNALNDVVWNIEVNGNGGGNQELQYYSKRGVAVEDGNLVLTAKREDYSGRQFTSGRINTRDKMYFTHGKIEFRAWMPETANGIWPAVWALGQSYGEVGWPRCSEIDFVEMGNATGIRNNTQDRYFNGACHWGFYIDGNYPNYANSVTAPYSMQDGYHTWTVVWDSQEVAMYYDLDRDPNRAAYYKMNLTDTNGDWAVGNYFHQPVFLVTNVAVGGNFTGILNAAGITAIPNAGDTRSLKIDYIKIYQNGGSGDTFYSTNGAGDGGEDSGVESVEAADAGYEISGRSVIFYSRGGRVCTPAGVEVSGISLNPGIYIVKPADAKASKIVVK